MSQKSRTHYKSSPLNNPVNDARDMATALKASGFNVTIKLNAGQRTMERAIRDFGRDLQKGGVGLFYYAGHGVQVKGLNYLIPVGSEIESEGDVKYECVDASLVLAKMEDARNDLNIVILDACRNNPFTRGFRSSTPGLARMDAPAGSLIAYSTGPGSVAADGEGRNGLYTKHLLENIRKPGLKVEDILKKVRIAVRSETSRKQTPWELSSLTGDFYFFKSSDDSQKKGATLETLPSQTKENSFPDISRLHVNAVPEGAKVRILNIKPRYFPGMALDPGQYHIEVSAKGFNTSRHWITLNSKEHKSIDIVLVSSGAGLPVVAKAAKKAIATDTADIDLDTLLAMAKKKKDEEERIKNQALARKRAQEQERKRKIEQEKSRKKELAALIKKYETLINNYGDTYKKQACNAICVDFPFLTEGVKYGDITGLRMNAELFNAGDAWTDPVTSMEQHNLSEEQRYLQAKKKFDADEFGAALEEFRALIKRYPKSKHGDNAQFWIGEIYYREKWYEKAIVEYQKVIEKYANGNKVAAALLKQGFSFDMLKDKANARLLLQELIKKYPESKEARVAKKKLEELYGMEQYNLTEEQRYLQAKKKFDADEFDAALEEFRALIKRYPKSKHGDNAQFWIGEIYYREKWYEKAILEYQKVIEKYANGNKVAAALLKQGFSFDMLKDKANARLLLRELIKKYPESKEALVAQKKLKEL